MALVGAIALLFGVSPVDPLTMAATATVLGIVPQKFAKRHQPTKARTAPRIARIVHTSRDCVSGVSVFVFAIGPSLCWSRADPDRSVPLTGSPARRLEAGDRRVWIEQRW